MSIVMSLLACLMWVGIASAQAPAAGGDVVRIGAAVGITGALARDGQQTLDGYKIWEEQINKAGGIKIGDKKYRVQVIYYDDKSDAQTSAKLVEKLITEDKVQFLFGPFSSGITIAAAAISERYKVITMASAASSPAVYARGYKYLFGMLPRSDIQLQPIVEMLGSMSPRASTVAIVAPDDLFPRTVAEGGKKMLEDKGLKVVYYEKHPKGVQDFSPILARLKELNPDILVGTGYIADNIQIVKQMKELRVNPRMVVFTTATMVPDFVTALGKDAEGVMGTENWISSVAYKDDLFGGAAEYAKVFKQRFGHEPSSISAAATGAARVLQMAIERAGNLDVEAVRGHLTKIDAEMMFGRVKYDPSGLNVGGSYFSSQFQGGTPRIIWPERLQQAKPLYPKPTW